MPEKQNSGDTDMKKQTMTINTIFAVALLFSASVFNISALAENQSTSEKKMEITAQAKLVEGPADYFTGHVTIGTIFKPAHEGYSGAMVNFDAKARTAWHTHPKGQTLLIISGEGRAQTKGKAIQILKPGDVVWIPAGEKHWHGAAPDSAMSHVAIQSPDENGNAVTWMEHVTDEQYMMK